MPNSVLPQFWRCGVHPHTPHFAPIPAALLTVALFTVPLGVNGNTTVVPAKDDVPTNVTPLPVREYLDLVDERPSIVGVVLDYSAQAAGWAWDRLYNNVLYMVSPPSTTGMAKSIMKADAVKLFKFLGHAGYKLKVIDTDVGIIPGLKIKFGQVRELSEADIEYLEEELTEWERQGSGMYDAIQRSIMKTVLALNASSDYRVTTLEIKLLPLPDVAFTMIPKKVFLGEEGSVLMRAIQRVERGIRKLDDMTPK